MGAVVTGFIAVLIALVANGVVPALIVLAIVIGIQQLEGHVLQPLLLGRAVALHPLAVTLAVAAGVVVAGIAGALLAVPLLAVLTSAVRSLAADHEPDASEVDALDPTQGHPPAVLPPAAPEDPPAALPAPPAAVETPGAEPGRKGQSDACDT